MITSLRDEFSWRLHGGTAVRAAGSPRPAGTYRIIRAEFSTSRRHSAETTHRRQLKGRET